MGPQPLGTLCKISWTFKTWSWKIMKVTSPKRQTSTPVTNIFLGHNISNQELLIRYKNEIMNTIIMRRRWHNYCPTSYNLLPFIFHCFIFYCTAVLLSSPCVCPLSGNCGPRISMCSTKQGARKLEIDQTQHYQRTRVHHSSPVDPRKDTRRCTVKIELETLNQGWGTIQIHAQT